MYDIPTYDHSKKDSDVPDKPSFHFYAAKISIVAPIVSVIFFKSVAYGLKDIKTPWSVLIIAGVSLLLAGIYIVSLVLGLVALTGVSRPGNEGSLLRAVLGILASTALLGWWSAGFVHGFQTAMQKHKEAESITQTAREIKEDLKKEVAEKGAVNSGTGEAGVQKMKTALDKASKNLTGDDALVAKAASAYVTRLQSVLADYTAAAQAIKSPPVLNMSSVDQRDQLAARKETVNKFLAANEKMMSFFMKAETVFHDEMVREKVSQTAIENELKSYRTTADERNFLQIQIRMTDQRIGNAMLGMLDLLDSNWGNWKYNSEKKNVTFQDTDVVAKYNEYFRDMTAASTQQQKLQSQLLSLPAVASAQ